MTNNFDEELREFALITSAHGVRYIFHGHRIVVKVIFFLFWISAVLFCIVRASVSVRKYMEEKTTTLYEMHPASASAIMDFPTITACNYNKIRKSYLATKPELKDWFQGISLFDFDQLENLNWESPELKKFENITYADLLREGEMYNDTFITCTQGHLRYCHDTDMGDGYFSRDVEFVSGSCFRINPEGNLKGKSGDYGVLSLILIADKDEYIDTSHNIGWLVATHEAERYGASIDNGIKISPGQAYYINLDTMIIHNHKKHCAATEGKISGYGRYDQSTCLLDCRDRMLNKTCGCLNSTPPLNDVFNYKECTIKQVATCSLKAYYQYVLDFADVKSDYEECGCDVVACEYTLFRTTVTATPLPDTEIEHKLKAWNSPRHFDRFQRFSNYTAEDLAKNMARIEFFFGSSSITKVEEIISYDFDNLLGDIGGVMGLFLGASIFTTMEFCTLVVNLLSRLWQWKIQPWLRSETRDRKIISETNL